MKSFIAILCLCIPLSCLSQAEQKQTEINISFSRDTIYNNQEPYCLLDPEGDTYIIRNFFLERMAKIEPIIIGADEYYKLDVSMLYKTFYIKPSKEDFVKEYIQYMIVNGALDIEGYYDEYGTRSLVSYIEKKGITVNYQEIEALKKEQKNQNWAISYKNTTSNDSTLILADREIRAYYKITRWEDLGVDRYTIATSSDYANTRYYIYSLDNSLVAEIRKPWDGITMTVILANKEELKFRYLPKDKNIVTLTTKLLLAKELL